MSTVPQVIIVCISIAIAYNYMGMYGIAVAGLGMLSIISAITELDTYGPISDNAGGIAEMSELEPGVRKVTDRLDMVGNTVKALTKGFAMGASALISLALLSAFFTASKLTMANLLNPAVLIGVLLGAMVPFMFSSFCMNAVGRTAFQVVEEVRRQWREIKGLAEGKAKPDYARCVDICTQASIRELVIPGLIVVAAPILVGLALGTAALAGFLAGAVATAFVLAALMVNAGGAWDNAKKFIEEGGKGTPTHAAAVVGDTLGDPFKDTAGPALNIVIKLMAIVSLVLAPVISQYALNLLG
ncbi:K(+)-stimulated pyrophosphate-energized sodium pump [uncultured archaeon]|nr:K(+)-stimulated pyrophosphate-energized sodium pump [uncultured archaeon]